MVNLQVRISFCVPKGLIQIQSIYLLANKLSCLISLSTVWKGSLNVMRDIHMQRGSLLQVILSKMYATDPLTLNLIPSM